MLQSPTVGLAPWSPALDENIGRAALYVPSDYGLPPCGVRAEGQVFIRRDWPEQFDPARVFRRD